MGKRERLARGEGGEGEGGGGGGGCSVGMYVCLWVDEGLRDGFGF